MPEPARAKPKPTPGTRHFWDGTQAGELRLQRCDGCAHVYWHTRAWPILRHAFLRSAKKGGSG